MISPRKNRRDPHGTKGHALNARWTGVTTTLVAVAALTALLLLTRTVTPRVLLAALLLTATSIAGACLTIADWTIAAVHAATDRYQQGVDATVGRLATALAEARQEHVSP